MTVDGAQDEGCDDIAFPDFFGDPEFAPAVPAACPLFKLGADLLFPFDQGIGQEPVGLSPGIDQLLGYRIT
ncbi:hypothetical protein D3C87_2122060 [compost metagenome]